MLDNRNSSNGSNIVWILSIVRPDRINQAGESIQRCEPKAAELVGKAGCRPAILIVDQTYFEKHLSSIIFVSLLQSISVYISLV